jgi:hypothetical protein
MSLAGIEISVERRESWAKRVSIQLKGIAKF